MRGRHVGMLLLLLLLGLVIGGTVAAASPSPSPSPAVEQVDRDARALGEQLVAPCCWRETLGSHNSPLANELRVEIRARLVAGESRDAIEDDLVARFGPRVRALPRDWDPRLVFGGLAFTAAALLLVLLVRWTHRRRDVPAAPVATAHDEHLEDVLDDELAALDA